MAQSSAKDEWETPDDFFATCHEEFNFDLDACACVDGSNAKLKRHFTVQDNALHMPWNQKGVSSVWCNPPYGRGATLRWTTRAAVQATDNELTVVLLLPARTDTKWFHEVIMQRADEIRFVRGRLRFKGAKNPAPFPSMVVVFRPGDAYQSLAGPALMTVDTKGKLL